MSNRRKKFLKLQYYRKKYGYKQSDMAVLLGICQSGYSHKELGVSPFSYDEMVKIHFILNKKAKKERDEPLSLDEIFLD